MLASRFRSKTQPLVSVYTQPFETYISCLFEMSAIFLFVFSLLTSVRMTKRLCLWTRYDFMSTWLDQIVLCIISWFKWIWYVTKSRKTQEMARKTWQKKFTKRRSRGTSYHQHTSVKVKIKQAMPKVIEKEDLQFSCFGTSKTSYLKLPCRKNTLSYL